MGFFELITLAVGLSMDAFAVSVCKGLAIAGALAPGPGGGAVVWRLSGPDALAWRLLGRAVQGPDHGL